MTIKSLSKNNFKFFGTAQDHKKVKEKDQGPNTGGMGAYSPAPIVNKSLEKKINMKQLVEKAVNSTYKLSKRQITWLNKFTTTKVFEKNESNKVIKIESFI